MGSIERGAMALMDKMSADGHGVRRELVRVATIYDPEGSLT